jgi:hypothetical protein
MISKVEGVIRRARKFYSMVENGQALDDIKKNPEWFTEEELHEFHLAQDVCIAAEWKRTFGTSGPVSFEIPRDSKELDEMAKGYQAKVQKELNKGQPKRKKGSRRGTTSEEK